MSANGASATRGPVPTSRAPITFELALSAEQLDALADLVAERLVGNAQTSAHLDDGWLNTQQAADYLGCSADRLHDLVARRALAHGRDGRRLLFRRSDLDVYAENGSR